MKESFARIVLLALSWSSLALAADAPSSRPVDLPLAGGTPDAPVFRAADLLQGAQLSGPDYTVESLVPVKESRFQFVLQTPYGRIPAPSRDMLELRTEEMRCIDRARRLAKEPQVVNGVMDSFKQTGQGLRALVTDPGDTLKSIPKGIGRTLKSFTDKSSRRGGGETRRAFAAEMGADPETRNPVLKKMLDKLSLKRGIGQSVISVATIGATGGVAMAAQAGGALRTTASMQDILRTTPLYKINENIAAELGRMGVPPNVAEDFSKNLAFTTLQRMWFMEQYRRVRNVRGAPAFVELASRVPEEPDALAIIHVLGILGDLHAREPIERLTIESFPVAQLASGKVVVVSAADYSEPDSAWKNRTAKLRELHPKESVVLVSAGRLSARARQLLAENRIESAEQGEIASIK